MLTPSSRATGRMSASIIRQARESSFGSWVKVSSESELMKVWARHVPFVPPNAKLSGGRQHSKLAMTLLGRGAELPIYQAIAAQLHDAINKGTLRAGDRMPSVRNRYRRILHSSR